MNYITSCPACETQFLLTKDQLKAHRGKVQCGNCEHIFNAKNRLTEISDEINSTAEYKASLEEHKTEEFNITAAVSLDEKPVDSELGSVLGNVLENVPSLQDLAVYQDDAAIYANEPSLSNDIAQAIAEEPIYAPIRVEDLTAGPSFDDPQFAKAKTKFNIWLALLAILLALLAGVQTVYAKRTQIAVEYPQFKPFLQQVCVALTCDINLPKNVDLLTIDDSDMQEDENHADVIKFTSLLINNANYVQAYPDIELTLTAADDQPVLRRLIKPAEYLSANTDMAAGLGARQDTRVNLSINVKDLAVAGYRVLLVY